METVCINGIDFKKYSFSANIKDNVHINHEVYETGEGKVIILLQELPGIDRNTLELTKALVNEGFKVILPHLLGKFGEKSLVSNTLRILCIRRELDAFNENRDSPIVTWLNLLIDEISHRLNAKKVGVIGMCLTGNFAISLITHPNVEASVACEPSLPILKPNKLFISEADVLDIKAALELKGPIKAYRYKTDRLCTYQKFEKYRNVFNNDGKERITLNQIGPEKGKKRHSVLTKELFENHQEVSKEAFNDIVSYFFVKL